MHVQYVYVCIYIYVHVRVNLHIFEHVYIHIYIYTCQTAYQSICQMCVRTDVGTHGKANVRICVGIYVVMSGYVRVSMFVRMFILRAGI